MTEPKFGCICNDPDKQTQQVHCVMCSLIVHSQCYKAPQDRSFYCEACLLQMYDPLIGNSDSLKCEPLVDNTDKKMGLRNMELQLNQKQVQELESGASFLNLFVIQKGHLTPTFDNLQVMIDRASFSLNTERYNLINTQKLDLSHSGQRRGCSIKIRVFLNEPDINGKLNVTLANRVDPSHLYNFVSLQKATMLIENIPLDYSWKSLISKSRMSSDTSVLSLLDPLTLLLMNKPGKGILCTHPAFFCLETYIKLNLQIKERDKQWCCPICKKRLFYQELFWDDDLQKDLDSYRKNNKQVLESSSSGSSDNGLGSKKAREESQTELPRFKLYLHKGKVCTVEEIVKLAPWVLRQPPSSSSKQADRSRNKTPSKPATQHDGPKTSKTRAITPELPEESSLLKKRKPNPLQGLLTSKPTKKALEQVALVQRRGAKQSLEKSRIKPEENVPRDSQILEKETPKRRNSLTMHTGSRKKAETGNELQAPHDEGLDRSNQVSPASPGQQPEIKLRDEDSFEFLSDSSETNKDHQAPLAAAVMAQEAGKKLNEESGQASETPRKSMMEIIKSQEPFKVLRDEAELLGNSRDGPIETSILSKPRSRSIGMSAHRNLKSSSTQQPLSPRLGAAEARPLKSSSRHERHLRNVSNSRSREDRPSKDAKHHRSTSARGVKTLQHSLMVSRTSRLPSPPAASCRAVTLSPSRCIPLHKPDKLVLAAKHPLFWEDRTRFSLDFSRWLRRTGAAAKDSLPDPLLAEPDIQRSAKDIISSCSAGPREEFHHVLLMKVLCGGCPLGYEGVGYLLGEVCALLNPEKSLPLMVSYLQLFTIRRYGVPLENLFAAIHGPEVKWIDQNQGPPGESPFGWLPVQQLTDLMFGMLKSFMRQQVNSDPAITLNDFLEVASRLIAAFLSTYTYEQVDPPAESGISPKSSLIRRGSEKYQVSSWIIDNFSRQLTSMLLDPESPPDSQRAGRLLQIVSEALVGRVADSLSVRETVPATQ